MFTKRKWIYLPNSSPPKKPINIPQKTKPLETSLASCFSLPKTVWFLPCRRVLCHNLIISRVVTYRTWAHPTSRNHWAHPLLWGSCFNIHHTKAKSKSYLRIKKKNYCFNLAAQWMVPEEHWPPLDTTKAHRFHSTHSTVCATPRFPYTTGHSAAVGYGLCDIYGTSNTLAPSYS